MCRVGPLPLAACGLSTTQRAYLPPHVPGAILIVSASTLNGFHGRERCGEGRPGGPLCIRISGVFGMRDCAL
jgi:hypothetical protein